MTIIVEDGTLVDSANSFVTTDELREYAADRGTIITPDDDIVSPHLIKATDYLWALDGKFKGDKITQDQSMPFPRAGIVLSDGTTIAADHIPSAVARAQLELAFRSFLGTDVLPVRTADNPELKRKKIGPIEKEWFQGTAVTILPIVIAFLEPYMRNVAPLQVVRV